MKTWAKWTLLILWTLFLILTSVYWNPFTSFPALLKYSVVSVIASAIFGTLIIIIQYYILISLIFPLPPRADAKAPKSFWRSAFPFLFKKPTINPKAPTRLDELIGNTQAKIEIREVVDMLSHPERYTASGADVPKGMLFIGPPGVGKTLFARAIANEVGIPFYVVEGSALSGLIMGLGVIKLKTLFAKLRKHDKAILFIDEIDSVGARRQGDRGFGGVADMNMTLNTLLTEMDGFKASNILVIGATNNDGILDPALMRAGRMDRRIYFQTPSPEERRLLFGYYLGKVLCDPAIDLDELSKLTANYSAAEIANAVNEAALIGSRPGGPGKATTGTVIQALDRISVGLERSLVGSGIEVNTTDTTTRLDDVIGIDDVKQDVLELIDFLKHGEELRKIGAKIPKGLLFVGPPGVGKTMLAKAVANEAGVPFYGISASYLRTAFVGEDAGRIRALYAQARKSPAAIVFFDEVDAIGGTMTEGGNNRTTALNQMLIELDGISHSNVITIGATNIEENLDPAFMRSGRFDRKCYIGLPDSEARKKIFSKYLSTIQLASQPDLEKLSRQTTNFSGADIAATVNEAAFIAVRNKKTQVDEVDLEAAVDRISVTAGHKLNTYGMNLSRVPDINIRLSDIKGIDEATAEAAEIVAMIKNADLIRETNFKIPKGILLVGPPGTGKTMLAKAIANEAGVAFYSLSGGDFQSKWAGIGVNRVRSAYEQARRSGKPAIVFIDEIDSIGGKRGQDLGGGAIQDSNKTLNQLLVEMDGFGKHKVLTIGATNEPGLLDNALLRPGRFDRRIDMPYPNLEGREAILEQYLKNVKTDETVSARDVARMTVWKAGADLANIVNEAGLIALRHGRKILSQVDLIKAVQRTSFGMSYSRQVLMEELRATAFHEAGHAIVAYFRNRRDRIQVVTVVPSGGALGYVWQIGKEDYTHSTYDDYLVDIEISVGSLVAEKMFLGTTGSGVSDDLRKAGSVASNMVRRWGMGKCKFNTYEAFGKDRNGYHASDETERELELEIKAIIDSCMESAEKILGAHRNEVELIAQALVEKETLYFKDMVAILEPHKTDSEIEKELRDMAERKLVGKQPIITIDGIGTTFGGGIPGNGSEGRPTTDGGAPGGASPGSANNKTINNTEENRADAPDNNV